MSIQDKNSKLRIHYCERGTSFLSSPFFLTYYINLMYRSFLVYILFTLISREINLNFLSMVSVQSPLSRGNTFFLSQAEYILLITSIHTYTHLFLFHARIHLLVQFLTRLNSNLLLIVTHERAKRSGTFAGVLLQTNIFLLTYPACRSSLPRAET